MANNNGYNGNFCSYGNYAHHHGNFGYGNYGSYCNYGSAYANYYNNYYNSGFGYNYNNYVFGKRKTSKAKRFKDSDPCRFNDEEQIALGTPNGLPNGFVETTPTVLGAYPPAATKPNNMCQEIDERLFGDPRPIINFIPPGAREYRLFDDLQLGSDNIRSVYNVNNMDVSNPREICSRRLLPKSVVYWPVDLMENDMNLMKKSILRMKGQTSYTTTHQTLQSILDLSSNESPRSNSQVHMRENKSRHTDVGLGLVDLARFVNGESIDTNPMGFITFLGFNLHKLFKDLDKTIPITPTFPGPLADRNHSTDFNHVEVMNPMEEYNFPHNSIEDGGRAIEDWKKAFRFKRKLMGVLPLDTLFYIFYTMCGDAMQLLIAKELYARGWRFHKVFQVWLLRSEECVGDADAPWETGTYTYFNYLRWQQVQGAFRVNDSLLEGEPQEFSEALWN